jgi:hypothetical protein
MSDEWWRKPRKFADDQANFVGCRFVTDGRFGGIGIAGIASRATPSR